MDIRAGVTASFKATVFVRFKGEVSHFNTLIYFLDDQIDASFMFCKKSMQIYSQRPFSLT